MGSHTPSVNYRSRVNPYTPLLANIEKNEEINESAELNEIAEQSSPVVANEAEEYIKPVDRKRTEDPPRSLLIRYNSARSTLEQYQSADGRIPNISLKPTKNLVNSLTRTESAAASTYVKFQKHFVKLNSILQKNSEGIIQLSNAVPGFFELQGGETAHFCFKNQSRGVVKFQVNKMPGSGRVLTYVSDFYRKPTISNAQVVIDVRRLYCKPL